MYKNEYWFILFCIKIYYLNFYLIKIIKKATFFINRQSRQILKNCPAQISPLFSTNSLNFYLCLIYVVYYKNTWQIIHWDNSITNVMSKRISKVLKIYIMIIIEITLKIIIYASKNIVSFLFVGGLWKSIVIVIALLFNK